MEHRFRGLVWESGFNMKFQNRQHTRQTRLTQYCAITLVAWVIGSAIAVPVHGSAPFDWAGLLERSAPATHSEAIAPLTMSEQLRQSPTQELPLGETISDLGFTLRDLGHEVMRVSRYERAIYFVIGGEFFSPERMVNIPWPVAGIGSQVIPPPRVPDRQYHFFTPPGLQQGVVYMISQDIASILDFFENQEG